MRTAASIEARVGARQRPTHGRSMAPTRGRESSGLLRLSSRGGTRIPDPVINRQVRPYYGLRDRSKDRSTRQRLARGSEGRRVRKSQDHLDPEVVSHKHFRPVGTPLVHQAVGTPDSGVSTNGQEALCGNRGGSSRRVRGSGWSAFSSGATRAVRGAIPRRPSGLQSWQAHSRCLPGGVAEDLGQAASRREHLPRLREAPPQACDPYPRLEAPGSHHPGQVRASSTPTPSFGRRCRERSGIGCSPGTQQRAPSCPGTTARHSLGSSPLKRLPPS